MQTSSAKMTETIGPHAEHNVGCSWSNTVSRRVLKSMNTASACRKVLIMMATWKSYNSTLQQYYHQQLMHNVITTIT